MDKNVIVEFLKARKLGIECKDEIESKGLMRFFQQNQLKWESGEECSDERDKFDEYYDVYAASEKGGVVKMNKAYAVKVIKEVKPYSELFNTEPIEEESKPHIMEVIANYYYLELGERFHVNIKEGNLYAFKENGLIHEHGYQCPQLLTDILTGEAIIIKIPWKPKYGDRFYYVNDNGIVENTIYYNTLGDKLCVFVDNFFKTQEEAEKNKESILEKLNSI